MDEEREIEYWSTNRDADSLCATTVDEAVDEWLDNLESEEYENPPATITVYGWARMQPSAKTYTRWVLERLLESIDEDHADPNGTGYTIPSESMIEAERTFVEAVLSDYESWACECVTERAVETAPYIAVQREADARHEALNRVAKNQASPYIELDENTG